MIPTIGYKATVRNAATGDVSCAIYDHTAGTCASTADIEFYVSCDLPEPEEAAKEEPLEDKPKAYEHRSYLRPERRRDRCPVINSRRLRWRLPFV